MFCLFYFQIDAADKRTCARIRYDSLVRFAGAAPNQQSVDLRSHIRDERKIERDRDTERQTHRQIARVRCVLKEREGGNYNNCVGL